MITIGEPDGRAGLGLQPPSIQDLNKATFSPTRRALPTGSGDDGRDVAWRNMPLDERDWAICIER
jgi:hypothetical protein